MRETDIAWLAGLLDGEGCFYIRKSTRKHTTVRVDCFVQLVMTDRATIEYAAPFMRELSKDPCTVRPRKAALDRRGYNSRLQWVCATSSKEGALYLSQALAPYLFTKRLESHLCVAFLKRATTSGKYRATELDHRIADLAQQLKQGCEGAPAEAEKLLSEVISNQVIGGTSKEETDKRSTD